MRRNIIIIVLLGVVIFFGIAWAVNSNQEAQLNRSKLSELRQIADKTSKLTQLGQNLERTEDDEGYYTLKGGKHFRWSVRDAYRLYGISKRRIENIDKIMVAQGWNRQDSIKPTLAEDYSWAKQYYNSYDLRYSKTTNSNIVCQRFSFWWDNKTTENNIIANTFVYTEFTDLCRK